MADEMTCICGCGEPAVYAAAHVTPRFRHGITETDYVVEDRGYATPCWIWQLELMPNGYGRLSRRGRRTSAHRASYEQFVGPVADGHTIDHLCEQRPCVRPEHLEAVTHAENCRRAKNTKLTEADVRVILTSPLTDRELAERYDVNVYTISAVRTGRNWSDVATDLPRQHRARGRNRKITDDQAAAILDSDEKADVLAERFGISAASVHRIRAGTQWARA